MPSRDKRVTEGDTKFDRRSANRASQKVVEERRGGVRVDGDESRPRKRRATRDGREPLVVYMQPEAIKALKIAALQYDTTASAMVSEAVSAWLDAIAKRRAR